MSSGARSGLLTLPSPLARPPSDKSTMTLRDEFVVERDRVQVGHEFVSTWPVEGA